MPVPIASIAIRACPKLPPTTEERIADNRAQTVADSVMYREALATAAEACGWSVHWYGRERVFRDAAAALGREDVDAFLTRWADRWGHLGRLNTSSRQLRRLRLPTRRATSLEPRKDASMTSKPMQRARVDGAELEVEVTGAGEPVLLIDGAFIAEGTRRSAPSRR